MSCPEVYRYMTPSPQTIQRDAVLVDARASMQRYGVRHLPVLDGSDLVGILYERELAVAERVADPFKVAVGDVMSPDPFLALPSTPLAEVAAEMVRSRFGVAVIIDRGNVVGVFTAVDALRALAEGSPSQRRPDVVPT